MAQVPAKNACEAHPKQVYQYFCENDDVLACRLCVTDTHKGHMLTDLNEYAKSKRSELELHVGNMKKELTTFLSEKIQNDRLIDEMEHSRVNVLQNVNQKAHLLKMEVDKAKQRLEDEFDSVQNKDLLQLKSRSLIAESCIGKLQQHIQNIQSQILSRDSDMLHWISSTKFDPQCHTFLTELPSFIQPTEYMFCSMSIDNTRMCRLLGRIQSVYFKDHVCKADEFQRGHAKLYRKVEFKKIVPCAKHVGTVFPVNDELAWIGFQRPRILKLVSKDGTEKMSINVDFTFKDMILSTYGDIILTENKGTKMWKMTLMGMQSLFYDASPFQTRGMTVTKTGHILLCLWKKGSNGKIIQLNPHGDIVAEYSASSQGENLFCKPDRVLQNANDDVIVIDWETKSLVGLNANMKNVKFTYNGSPSPAGLKVFTPQGMANDIYGHIYIADYENHKIHILRPDGNLLSLLDIQELEKNWPRRLAVDDANCLWIGCDNATVYTVNLLEIGLKIK